MLKTLTFLLEYYHRKKEIYDRATDQLYMTRYYLFLKDRKHFPFNIFLHHFHKSDDPVLHDHPWNYITIVVKGGYWEYVPTYDIYACVNGEQKIWRGPGHIRRCVAESYHRIEIDPSVDCWTIFIPGIQRREWGFLEHNGEWNKQHWVHNEEFMLQRSYAK